MESLRGHFLVASPHLPDSNFTHTVVFIVQHDWDGAFGLILNRPTGKTLQSILEFADGSAADQPVFTGGPVPGSLAALHGNELYSDDEVLPGVFVAFTEENIRQLVEQPSAPLRIFNGYSGWGPGQLDDELKAGGWLTTRASQEEVFSDDSQLWSIVSGRIGLEIITSSLHPKHVPADPSMN